MKVNLVLDDNLIVIQLVYMFFLEIVLLFFNLLEYYTPLCFSTSLLQFLFLTFLYIVNFSYSLLDEYDEDFHHLLYAVDTFSTLNLLLK